MSLMSRNSVNAHEAYEAKAIHRSVARRQNYLVNESACFLPFFGVVNLVKYPD